MQPLQSKIVSRNNVAVYIQW